MSGDAIAKLAVHWAHEVPGVCGADLSARPTPQLLSSSDTPAQAGSVTMTLEIAIEYPNPVTDVSDRLRRHLRERLAATLGTDGLRCDVVVTDLVPRSSNPARVS